MARIFTADEITPVNEGKGRVFLAEDLQVQDLKDSPNGGQEPILESAKKDFKQVATGIYELAKAAGNVFIPGEENTILKIGKYFEEAHEKGELGDDAWNFAKDMLLTPIENTGGVVAPIINEGIVKGTPQAAEAIARKPFSFALDVSSALGIGKAAKTAIKGGVSLATGKGMADISKRVAKAEGIATARSAEELVDELGDAFDTLNNKIKVAADDVKAVLPKDPALGFTPKQVTDIIDDAINDIGVPISDASENAVETLSKYKARINKRYPSGNIPAPEFKQIIMDLDDDIDWNTPKSQKSNSAIKGLRAKTDKLLKDKFENYGEKMGPLAELVKTREEAAKLLKVQRRNGVWEIPDTAGSRMDRMFKGQPKTKTIEIMDNFGKQTGLDISGEMELSTFGKAFEKEGTQGARRAVIGSGLGWAVGGPGGAATGAAIGGVLDKWGGLALGKTIDISPKAFRMVGEAAEAIPSATLAVPAVGEAIKELGEKEVKE